MNEKWECYLCAREFSYHIVVSGYLKNYHPICKKCLTICIEEKSLFFKHLTYHIEYGDVKVLSGVMVGTNFYKLN